MLTLTGGSVVPVSGRKRRKNVASYRADRSQAYRRKRRREIDNVDMSKFV